MSFRNRSLLVILFFVAACGGSETSTDTATTPLAPAAPRDVCSMLTMDELNTAAGLKEAVGQSSKSGDADVCTWTGSGGKSVIVQVFPSASSYDQLYKTTAEEVTAVGEKAFFISDNTGGTLVAAKGSSTVSVQVMGGGTPETRKGEATAIAHVILGKV